MDELGADMKLTGKPAAAAWAARVLAVAVLVLSPTLLALADDQVQIFDVMWFGVIAAFMRHSNLAGQIPAIIGYMSRAASRPAGYPGGRLRRNQARRRSRPVASKLAVRGHEDGHQAEAGLRPRPRHCG